MSRLNTIKERAQEIAQQRRQTTDQEQARAAKREAPNLFDRATEIAEEKGFDDAIESPLGTDPERRGFLD